MDCVLMFLVIWLVFELVKCIISKKGGVLYEELVFGLGVIYIVLFLDWIVYERKNILWGMDDWYENFFIKKVGWGVLS